MFYTTHINPHTLSHKLTHTDGVLSTRASECSPAHMYCNLYTDSHSDLALCWISCTNSFLLTSISNSVTIWPETICKSECKWGVFWVWHLQCAVTGCLARKILSAFTLKWQRNSLLLICLFFFFFSDQIQISTTMSQMYFFWLVT